MPAVLQNNEPTSTKKDSRRFIPSVKQYDAKYDALYVLLLLLAEAVREDLEE
jgi:hypothetical protein